MAPRLLDFERPPRVSRRIPSGVETGLPANVERMPVGSSSVPGIAEGSRSNVYHKSLLDYPTVETWLRGCEDDIERGRDKHAYLSLLPVFSSNGCTRLDDITRFPADQLRTLAGDQGIDASIGLVNRIHAYAVEDVARLKVMGSHAF